MQSGWGHPALPGGHTLSGQIKNMGASIRQRLKNKGRELKQPFDQVLRRYAIERFLYRVSQSEYRDQFILKGAQMLIVWHSDLIRPTKDIDFLGFTENSLDNLKSIVRDLCARNRQDVDGICFDPGTVACERIKEDAEYEGVRVTLDGKLDTAAVHIQIDIGFNDAVTPGPETVRYPSLLGLAEPELRGYNRETQIAEKYEAMVKLGELNSRMKDFFDIWLLSSQFPFEQHNLSEALKATFQRRGTMLGEMPPVLGPDFAQVEDKQKQWNAFLRKNNLTYAPKQFSDVAAAIAVFMGPVLNALLTMNVENRVWTPPGPWSGEL